MKTCENALTFIFIVIPWIAGVVLASGFWLKALAIFFYPYALYLVVERGLVVVGLIVK